MIALTLLAPPHVAPQRFAAVRAQHSVGATVLVNGFRIPLGGSGRFRPRFGWEPRRLYRIRVTARDRAGDVRRLARVIRGRDFGIVTLAVRNLTRARAAGGCGYVHLRPRGFPPGRAPLALGDSVMLGAAWRLTRAGFETDTLCGRSPLAGLETLRRRRRRGTLPSVVVVALGTNAPMRPNDIAAMLRVLGPRRKLVLVTQYRHWGSVGAGVVRRAARRHPGRVKVIGWSGVVRRHPSWLWGDGTHLHPRGLPGYTRLIHRGVWPLLRGEYIHTAR